MVFNLQESLKRVLQEKLEAVRKLSDLEVSQDLGISYELRIYFLRFLKDELLLRNVLRMFLIFATRDVQ